MLVGAHVSAAGGLYKAIERGERLGCQAIQIFSKNQRQWNAPALTDDEINNFTLRLKHSSIKSIIVHDSYLINLATPERDNLTRSLFAFKDELIRCDKLKIPYLVFHPGSHLGSGETTGIKQIAACLNESIEKTPNSNVMLLLEITAGQGSSIGSTFEQLADIINRVAYSDRVGICFDTAHAFAAGYDLRTPRAYQATLESFNRLIGLDKLKVFHVNDSKSGLSSRIDRHAKIGEGMIGYTAFELLMNDVRFSEIPKIIEIPGSENDYKLNLDLLKSMIKN